MPIRSGRCDAECQFATGARVGTNCLFFSEDLEGVCSTLKVVAANRQSVTDGASEVAAHNPRLLQVALRPLTMDTVKWHAVSRDGHTIAGEYTFQLEP